MTQEKFELIFQFFFLKLQRPDVGAVWGDNPGDGK